MRLDGVAPGTRSALFAVLLVAFGIKAAVFPLSTWLPDSYPTAPAPVTAVFAGLLTKVGVYAIIRAHSLLFPGGGLDAVLLVAALLTMLVGMLGAIAQNDIKRLLSFTLVSHIGYMVFGIALVSRPGMSGAIYYVAHHIIVQTTLFLVAGLIERQAGASTLRRLGGLAAASPLLALLFLRACTQSRWYSAIFRLPRKGRPAAGRRPGRVGAGLGAGRRRRHHQPAHAVRGDPGVTARRFGGRARDAPEGALAAASPDGAARRCRRRRASPTATTSAGCRSACWCRRWR